MINRISGIAFVILIGIVLGVTIVSAATSSNRAIVYRLGESIEFRVVSTPTNCCCCQPKPTVKILGWRIVSACGKVIDTVTYKTPVSAADWQAQWPEVNLAAVSKAEASVEASGPGTVYQAWDNAMSTYQKYWNGVESPVTPGWYTLYVDTTLGTLSRCLKLSDSAVRCQPCGYCPCVQPLMLTNCCWQVQLMVRVNSAPQYRYLTWHVDACRSSCGQR